MKNHKYQIGQKVDFRPAGFGQAKPPSDFRIDGLLPADGIDNQYRIESLHDGHKRVVHEGQLSVSA